MRGYYHERLSRKRGILHAFRHSVTSRDTWPRGQLRWSPQSVTLVGSNLPMLLFFENPLNESEYTFPILECIHIVGFAFSVGTIGLVDLRLLGVGPSGQSVQE